MLQSNSLGVRYREDAEDGGGLSNPTFQSPFSTGKHECSPKDRLLSAFFQGTGAYGTCAKNSSPLQDGSAWTEVF